MMWSKKYNTIHVWNLRHWEKSGVCEHCGAQAKTQWSNKSGEYRRGDRSDWQELCPKCHYAYDQDVLGNHPQPRFGVLSEDWDAI